ncbi:MAG: molecular chaperone DnaK, partial [Steroidobacter sp.]
PPADRANIENAVSDLKRALGGDDKDVIEKKAAEVSRLTAALAQQSAEAQGSGAGPQQGAGGGGAQGAGGNDDVLDAEFEEVKDKKAK